MDISANGIAFIEREEGKRNDAYHDSRGLLTIGVGHLVRPEDNIHFGDVITDPQVDTFLHDDLEQTVQNIRNAVSNLNQTDLNQNQFDALCSLVFNIGPGNFRNSTVRRNLNAGNYQRAADAFLLWKRAGNNPDMLLPRRQRERELFLTPVEATNAG